MIDGTNRTPQEADSEVAVRGKRSTESELASLFESLSCGGTRQVFCI